MLRCKECGVERPESDFFKSRTYQCGFALNQCRPCRVLYRIRNREREAARSKAWREAHPGYAREKNVQYYRDHKAECHERVRLWREKNPEKASQIEKRKYYKAKALGKLQPRRNKVSRDQYANNPEYVWRMAARAAARGAVAKGLIKKLPCEVCGVKRVEGHHHKGYEMKHWFDVQWLCRKHHRAAHGKGVW